MLSFQNSFLASHEGKSVNLLWEEIKGALQSGIEKYVPQRTVSTKPSLPWTTQEKNATSESETVCMINTRGLDAPRTGMLLSRPGTW